MNHFENVKAVIFDMDGVIFDSESVCDRTWEITFKEMNLPADMTILNECRGCNHADIARKLIEKFGPDFNPLDFLSHTSFLFHKIEDEEGIPLKPYAKEILEYLSSRYILCLASSTREKSVRKMLSDAGLISYFKTLTCGDMVVHSKPDPEIYIMACNSIGVKPEECVAIEDSYNGVRSAVAANIRTIMVPDKLPPTEEMKNITAAICNSLEQVQKIL